MKKAIVVVSFGTTYADTRKKTIEACEQDIAAEFPDYSVCRAFTAYGVINKLKKRDGIHVETPAEALERLHGEGFHEVIIQSLHLLPGEEFHNKIISTVGTWRDRFEKFAVGAPVFSSVVDYRAVIEALGRQVEKLLGSPASALPEKEAVVFMGHGSKHPANMAYLALQYLLDKQDLPYLIANVEAYPELPDVLPELEKRGTERVHLMPLMLVAGDHAKNDMAGDDEDSWKNVLEREGFDVAVYLHGLGENERFRRIYIDHARAAMSLL
jgi:sirohydrochlorin cobaltochelatase